MASSKKIAWADMTDDDPFDPAELGWDMTPIPVTVSKHGIKVKPKPSYVPPHLRDKSDASSKSKK
jgi:hypothetical protein